jgi:hypothetical protein
MESRRNRASRIERGLGGFGPPKNVGAQNPKIGLKFLEISMLQGRFQHSPAVKVSTWRGRQRGENVRFQVLQPTVEPLDL